MAYLPWVDMLHGLLEVSAEDPLAQVRDALRQCVETFCSDHFDEVYPFLGRMMSLPLEQEVEARLESLEPDGLKVLTFRAVERMLETATSAGPVVLVCEDLHWADASSLELLEQVLALTDRCSLLLMFAFRPYAEHGCWAIRETIARHYRHRHTDLWLQPLSAVDSEALVANLLHVEALPHPLRMRILDHAEGNPFYVEEVIRSLIDSGSIVYDEAMAQWEATRRVEDIAIPGTLQGVLMARIDRLEEGARRALQMASVIGRIFLYRVLSAIAREEMELDQRLLTLQREEMIRERARVPELEYIFKHHLTQEAAYNGLLRRERRRFHRQVAEALERLYPDRLEEQLGRLADHWEQAGERGRAVGYLRRAGKQAAAQFANTEAIGYFSRALDLAPEGELPKRYELLLALEGVYDLMGAREAQRQELARLAATAEALGDDGRRAEVALRRAQWAIRISDFSACIAAAQRAVCLAGTASDVHRESAGYGQWGMALHDQGDYKGSLSRFEHGLALSHAARTSARGPAEITESLRLEADSLRRMGFISFEMGSYDEGRAYCEQALRIVREIDDRRGEAGVLSSLGVCLTFQGELDEAKACFERVLRIAREIGDRRQEGWALLVLGNAQLHLGEYASARDYQEQALRILRESGFARGGAQALSFLGLLFHCLGDDESAQVYGQQSLLAAQSIADPDVQSWALLCLGHARLNLGLLDGAAGAYREALALRRQMGAPHRANDALAGLARSCLAQGDPAGAQAHVDEILEYLQASTLDGTFEPGRVYLTCYRVLKANDDPRAHQILDEGYRFLQERAVKVSDEGERRSYLENVAANREIVEEWVLSVNE